MVDRVVLELTRHASRCDYASNVVKRSFLPSFGFAEVIGTTDATLFEDVGAAADGDSYYYRVFPANACGQEAP